MRDSVTALEHELANIAALLPKSVPGAPRLRSPYTVSEAVSLDEIEKKAAAKLSSVCLRCSARDRPDRRQMNDRFRAHSEPVD